jgi:hypothetical protein
VQRISLRHFYYELLCNLTSSAGEHELSFLNCWCSWIAMRYPAQMYSLLLLGSFPIPIGRQDPTRGDHTLGLHEELLELFSNFWCCPDFILRGTDLHVNKKIDFIPLPWEEDGRKVRLSISIHLNSHIFDSINHKIHKLVWFALISGFLLK